MTDQEWDGWAKANVYYYRTQSPCCDCTISFAMEMSEAGKCDGIPPGMIRMGGREKMIRTERIQQILDMRMSGSTYDQIAIALKVHRSTVWRVLTGAIR